MSDKPKTRLMMSKKLFWAMIRSVLFCGLLLSPAAWLQFICGFICASNALYALVLARTDITREVVEQQIENKG